MLTLREPSKQAILPPQAITIIGRNPWVLNYKAVAELSPSGRPLRVLRGPYGTENPESLVASSSALWAVIPHGGYHGNGAVAELSPRTGHPVRIFAARKYGFHQPFAIAVHGNRVWILSNHSVTELSLPSTSKA